MRYSLVEKHTVQMFILRKEGIKIMKRLWRRVLLLSVMFVLAMSVRSLAATTQYSAKTITFPNAYGGGWSNQFTLSNKSNITIGINMYNNYTKNFGNLAYNINSKLSFVLENVYTGAKFTPKIPNYYSVNYELKVQNVPAGTYSFGAYYTGSYAYNLYFRVVGSTGINVPDSFEILVGSTETIPVSQMNTSGSDMYITGTGSSNTSIAYVSSYNNSKSPSTITIYGNQKGSCTITVYGADGTSDSMKVKVVSKKTAPTLLYGSLSMTGGEKVYNEVLNTSSKVTWSSSKKTVAKVNSKGKITAVGYGTATITAKTTKNGTTYELACKVSVKRSAPLLYMKITSFKGSKKKVKISIKNKSGVDMTVLSSGAKLVDIDDETGQLLNVKTLKLKGAKQYTIKNGKTKKLTFTMSSKATGTKYDYYVRFRFKVDGKNYYGLVTSLEDTGLYILKSNLSTGNWLFACPASTAAPVA